MPNLGGSHYRVEPDLPTAQEGEAYPYQAVLMALAFGPVAAQISTIHPVAAILGLSTFRKVRDSAAMVHLNRPGIYAVGRFRTSPLTGSFIPTFGEQTVLNAFTNLHGIATRTVQSNKVI